MKKLILLLFFFVFITSTKAQTDTTNTIKNKIEIIVTNDGGKFMGIVLTENEREIKIKDLSKGIIIIPKYAIKYRQLATEENTGNGEPIRPNFFAHEYNIMPSSFNVKKNEDRVSTLYYFWVNYEHGITNNFSLGISGTFFLTPFYLNAKYSWKINEKNRFMASLKLGSGLSFINNASQLNNGYSSIIGTASSIHFTHGTPENNNTIGLAYGTNFDSSLRAATISISGIKRIAIKASFVYDINYFYLFSPLGYNLSTASVVLFSPGIRLYNAKENAWTIAISIASSNTSNNNLYIIPIPLVKYHTTF